VNAVMNIRVSKKKKYEEFLD